MPRHECYSVPSEECGVTYEAECVSVAEPVCRVVYEKVCHAGGYSPGFYGQPGHFGHRLHRRQAGTEGG